MILKNDMTSVLMQQSIKCLTKKKVRKKKEEGI